jgi:hypothetical protein
MRLRAPASKQISRPLPRHCRRTLSTVGTGGPERPTTDSTATWASPAWRSSGAGSPTSRMSAGNSSMSPPPVSSTSTMSASNCERKRNRKQQPQRRKRTYDRNAGHLPSRRRQITKGTNDMRCSSAAAQTPRLSMIFARQSCKSASTPKHCMPHAKTMGFVGGGCKHRARTRILDFNPPEFRDRVHAKTH